MRLSDHDLLQLTEEELLELPEEVLRRLSEQVGHVNMKISRLVLLEFLGLRLILFWHLVDAETNEGAVNIAPASIRDARLDDLGKLIQGTPRNEHKLI
ncbi:MAG: hypothetical protein PHO08_20355 [Methylococcales bacterium]|nr:hypothetical protein [Methylococcales bacterium]